MKETHQPAASRKRPTGVEPATLAVCGPRSDHRATGRRRFHPLVLDRFRIIASTVPGSGRESLRVLLPVSGRSPSLGVILSGPPRCRSLRHSYVAAQAPTLHACHTHTRTHSPAAHAFKVLIVPASLSFSGLFRGISTGSYVCPVTPFHEHRVFPSPPLLLDAGSQHAASPPSPSLQSNQLEETRFCVK